MEGKTDGYAKVSMFTTFCPKGIMAAEKTFNEWSMKVLEELVSLNAKTTNLGAELEDKCNQIEKQLAKITETLTGNGDSSKGLIVRVDRLEQNENRRTWLLRATIVASLGAILGTISQWFKSVF